MLDPNTLRTRIRDTDGMLELIYPAKPELYGRIFVIVWLVIWAAGEIGVIWALSSGLPPFATAFLFLWLALWSMGGFVAVTYLIWNIAGFERMLIEPETATLTLTRSMPLWQKTTICALSEVRNFRVLADWEDRGDDDPRDNHGLLCAPSAGSLKFDYGKHKLGFGLEMPQTEADRILSVIGSAFPDVLPPKP